MKKGLVFAVALMLVASLFISCNSDASVSNRVTVGFSVSDSNGSKAIFSGSYTQADIDHYKIVLTDLSENPYGYAQMTYTNGSAVIRDIGTTAGTDITKSSYVYTIENIPVKTSGNADITDYKLTLSQGTWKIEVYGYVNAYATEKQAAYGKIDSQLVNLGTNSIAVTIGEAYASQTATLTVLFGALATNNSAAVPSGAVWTPKATGTGEFKVFIDATDYNPSQSSATNSSAGGFYYSRGADNRDYIFGTKSFDISTGWHTVTVQYCDGNGAVLRKYEKDVRLVADTTLTLSGEFSQGSFENTNLTITVNIPTLGAIAANGTTGLKVANIGSTSSNYIGFTGTPTFTWYIDNENGSVVLTGTTVTLSTSGSNALTPGYHKVRCVATYDNSPIGI